MNPFYEMFNQSYIQQQAMLQRQNHLNQVAEVQKSAKALKDFLDSLDKIQSAYQQMASAEYCAIICDYFRKHGMIE